MDDGVKEQLSLVLQMLRKTMIDNGVSMGVDKKGNLHFFDTDLYVREHRFDGIKVDINDLVK